MKKLFLFLFLFVLFGINQSFSARYNLTTKSYSSTSGVTSCPSGTILKTSSTTSAPTSGTITCGKIDSIAPSGSVSYSTTAWTRGNVTVTITCSDSQSGCNMYPISGWTISGTRYIRTFTSNTSGSISLKDNGGNIKTVSYSIANIDKIAPSGSVSYSTTAWTSGNITVTINCSDSQSGCNMYAISGWTRSGTKYIRTFSSNTSGSITLKDNVGNTRSVSYSVTKIDKTSPTGSISYSTTAWTNGNVTVTITCSDSLSGCNMYPISGWTISGTRYIRTFTANTSGNITIKDNVGNSRSVSYSIANIDKIKPTGSISYSTTAWTNGNVTATITCSDTGGSGCNMYAISGWTISGTRYIRTFTENTTGSITLKDNAGNTKVVPYSISNIDKLSPTVGYQLSGGTTTNDTWTNANVTAMITCSDTGGSGCNSSTYGYRVESSPFTCNSSGTWIPGSSKTISTASGTNILRYVCFRAKDVAGNGYIYSSVAIIKIDKVVPTIADITNTTSTQLLAINSQKFTLNVSTNGGSPITYIGAYFEDYNNNDTYLGLQTSNSGTWSENENISKVDNNRLSNGAREYSLRVSRICDQAGNCIGTTNVSSNLKTYTYKVYANSQAALFTTHTATTNLDNTSNVVDGSIKNITITLKDTYGNQIIPASGINREIDFTFAYENGLYSNQYKLEGNGVYSTVANKTTYLNDFNIGIGNLKFVNEDSSDGEYIYKFKVYSPTYDAFEFTGQELVNKNAIFDINSILADIRGDIGGNAGVTINNSNISSNFAPIYYTKINGELNDYEWVEGTLLDSEIFLLKDSLVTFNPSNKKLYIEFGSGSNNEISDGLNLIANLESGTGIVGEGNNELDVSKLFKSNFGVSSYDLNTLLSLDGGLLNDTENSYFSTHISYSIDGHDIVYNSDIIGKDNYTSGVSFGDSYLEGLKVIGLSHSKTQVDLIEGQSESDIHILGEIEKSALKEIIAKNTYSVVKNLQVDNSGNYDVKDLENFHDVSNDGTKLDDILYFGNLEGNIVTIDSNEKIDGQKTVVAIGGNIYIKNNILRNTSKDILGIIALKDEDGNGGNIYIDPDVTIIESILYAENSLISYNGFVELDGNTNQSILKNQLYIYGSVFSENTIGGSRNSPTPICPYYVDDTSCTKEEAQKYDLNYLRRYYVSSSGVPLNGGINYFNVYNGTDTYIGTDTKYSGKNYPYYNYPIVIEYNPSIQISAPPFFEG